MRTLSELPLRNLTVSTDPDGIATVTLNRPAKRNALDAATIDELAEVFTLLPRAGVRACVLRGEGTPLSDHRASAEYRAAMLGQALLRFFYESQQGESDVREAQA